MPHQSTVESSLSFGAVRYDKIKGGIIKFENIGKDHWGIQIDDISYGGKNMSKE